jgi:excisionase family DNA binding protein
MTTTEVLTPRQVAEIAHLVAEEVTERLRVAMDQGPSLLTRAQLARRLGVSVTTVDRYSRSGRIPVIRIGDGPTRFDFCEVAAALRNASPSV